MPRDLSEVLHFFMPELAPETGSAPAVGDPRTPGGEPPPRAPVPLSHARERRAPSSPLPIVAVPIGDCDVVRAALAWNLAVEVARFGARSVLIAPEWEDPSPLWPEAGIGPLGAELLPTPAGELGALYRVAIDAAVERADGAKDGGVVFVRVPPSWLRSPADGAGLLRWTLLLTSSHVDDLRETYAIGRLVTSAMPRAAVGVTIHGARSVTEAENAFGRLAHAAAAHLRSELQSYGLLVDDLHVYRAIVAQRPIGLAHPQSPAARALRDVAGMLLDDARQRAVA